MNILHTHLDHESWLRDNFTYNPETGEVVGRSGLLVTSLDTQGYIRLLRHTRADGVKKRHQFAAHRVAWLLHYGQWPVGQLDHINGIKTDNRITNLRDTTNRANSENRVHQSLGVQEHLGKFKAAIKIDGAKYYLGTYPTRELAERMYVAAKREFHEACRHWSAEKILADIHDPR